jgi:hypothetical protein
MPPVVGHFRLLILSFRGSLRENEGFSKPGPVSSKRERVLRFQNPFQRRPVRLVALQNSLPALPSHCANCGEIAGQSKKVERGTKLLLVPYCTRCFVSLEREETQRFAAVLASTVVAVTLLVTGLRLWPNLSVVGYAALVALGALVPVVIALVVGRIAKPGQSTSGRAVWWRRTNELACTNEGWGNEIAEKNDANARSERVREPFTWPLLSACVLGLAVSPVLHWFEHPEVVVLNLGVEPFVVLADGRTIARVPAMSLESPTAGVHLRLAAGTHRIELESEQGQPLASAELRLSRGRTHLYAPLSQEHCFWLERDVYGRAAPPEERYRALPDETRFWTLPRDIDTWFEKNPDPSGDQRSSGGTLVALRHARCTEAPSELQ